MEPGGALAAAQRFWTCQTGNSVKSRWQRAKEAFSPYSIRFPLARRGSPAPSLPLAASISSASLVHPSFTFFLSLPCYPKGKSQPLLHKWKGLGYGKTSTRAFLSVDNIVAALKDWLSRELCVKAGSKGLKCFKLRLVDRALFLSSSVWLVPSHALLWVWIIFFFPLLWLFFRLSSTSGSCTQLYFKMTSKHSDPMKSLCKLLWSFLDSSILMMRDILPLQTSQATASESQLLQFLDKGPLPSLVSIMWQCSQIFQIVVCQVMTKMGGFSSISLCTTAG